MNRDSSTTLSKLHRYQAVHQGKRSGLMPTGELGGPKEKEDTDLETLMKNLKNEQKQFLDHMSNNIPSVDLGKEIVFTDFVNRKKHFKQMSQIPIKTISSFNQTQIGPFNGKSMKELENKSFKPTIKNI
jgi:hypothetical protein